MTFLFMFPCEWCRRPVPVTHELARLGVAPVCPACAWKSLVAAVLLLGGPLVAIAVGLAFACGGHHP